MRCGIGGESVCIGFTVNIKEVNEEGDKDVTPADRGEDIVSDEVGFNRG